MGDSSEERSAAARRWGGADGGVKGTLWGRGDPKRIITTEEGEDILVQGDQEEVEREGRRRAEESRGVGGSQLRGDQTLEVLQEQEGWRKVTCS